MRVRRSAGFRPPYASRAAKSPAEIAVFDRGHLRRGVLVVHRHGLRRCRDPLVEHPLGRRQPLRVPADDDHLDGAAGRDERRPQRGMLRAPCVRTALAVSSASWTNTNVARQPSSATGSLWGKYRYCPPSAPW